MYHELKKHFPSLHYHTIPPMETDPQYQWFIAENGHVIGIHPSEINEKDSMFLHMFLKPYNQSFPLLTEEEKEWYRWVHGEVERPHSVKTYRFIYFQMPKKQIQPVAFKEAINQLFEKNIIILWESETSGVIVDIRKNEVDEILSLDEIIDVLMSDLYVNIRFFVGPYLKNLEHVQDHYKRIITGATTAFIYSESSVVSYIEAIPFMMVDQMTPDLKSDIQQLILQEFHDDKEFIQMVEVLLRSDLNISVAAKKLYMHRNSLQYRIEKFNKETGLDIRKFHHALTVYLALLTKKQTP